MGKVFSWTIAYISFMACLVLFGLNYGLKKENECQKGKINYLETKIETLESKQKNIEWLESELSAIDNYISVVDQLKLSGKGKFPEIKRTEEQLNQARIDVVKNAVYWDRVINNREVEK